MLSAIIHLTIQRAAELLNSFPESESNFEYESDTEPDSPSEAHADHTPEWSSSNFSSDPTEARLERKELPKFLMAKSFFDCREFDRCATTLLPSLLPQEPVSRASPSVEKLSLSSPTKSKGKGRAGPRSKSVDQRQSLPRLSQKSLFLALYAKYMAGEKRKEEDSEMILGPTDGAVTLNKELPLVSSILEDYLNDRGGLESSQPSQGFLEYLYGIVLLKGKSEQLAREWLLRSVNLYPWNWGAWRELADMLGSVEEVCNKCYTPLRCNELTPVPSLPRSPSTFLRIS